MMNISLAGLLGTIAGTAIAGVCYHLSIDALERWMLAQGQSQAPDAQADLAMTRSVVRRLVLAADLFVFAALGYWIGSRVWD